MRSLEKSNRQFKKAITELHGLGILVEPDSREPWFLCEAHDMECLGETLDKFEQALDITLRKSPAERAAIQTA